MSYHFKVLDRFYLRDFSLLKISNFEVIDVNGKIRDDSTDMLLKGILSLKDIEECYAFFEDICTIAELKSLAQRLQVARMLRNKKTYTDICESTGVSTATISRVNRCLEYGADGYKIVLDRLEGNDE